jgi:DNA-binding FadR family transcriptional regulator
MRPGLNIIQKLSGVSPIDMTAVRRIIEPRAAALAANQCQRRRTQGDRSGAFRFGRRLRNRSIRTLRH